jgi:hypothetical protein
MTPLQGLRCKRRDVLTQGVEARPFGAESVNFIFIRSRVQQKIMGNDQPLSESALDAGSASSMSDRIVVVSTLHWRVLRDAPGTFFDA